MSSASQGAAEWVDGFLFVANRPILDFLNTKPVLDGGPVELLPDFHALERWLIVAGIVGSSKTKSRLKSWRNSSEAAEFLQELIAFREKLRIALTHVENGGLPSDSFLAEVNSLLLQHPVSTLLSKRGGKVLRERLFEPGKLSDLWAPIADAAAALFSEPETSRLRQCESCVLHFFDTSKKGSRRWCSMNICGNKVKVAAYQRRKRASSS